MSIEKGDFDHFVLFIDDFFNKSSSSPRETSND